MRRNFFSYKQFLYSLDLPIDMIRCIKEFIGTFPKAKLIRDYRDYEVTFKTRHRKRIWSI